ncbi:MAG: hypothetical protein WCO75_04195 [Planctomycetota bacterium]
MTDYSQAVINIQKLNKDLHEHLNAKEWARAKTVATLIATEAKTVAIFCVLQAEA